MKKLFLYQLDRLLSLRAMKRMLVTSTMILLACMAKAQSSPDDHHPHMIDLGLPSGTKWACCNVGADKPEAFGGYYAWGETEEKETYNEVNYPYCEGENPSSYGWYEQDGQYQYLGDDIAGTPYDVAHVKWGGSWVMPSVNEIKELLNNSIGTMTYMNGVCGQSFTSKNNGAVIFLPASSLHYPGIIGEYWSSSQQPSEKLKWAYGLYFHSDSYDWDSFARAIGLTVRPVISATNSIHLPESTSDQFRQAIFSIYGIKVADNPTDMKTLPPGIYIVNGKKHVIK